MKYFYPACMWTALALIISCVGFVVAEMYLQAAACILGAIMMLGLSLFGDTQ